MRYFCWLTIWTNRANERLNSLGSLNRNGAVSILWKEKETLVGAVFARLIFIVRRVVIDVQIYTHFKLNKYRSESLCWIEGKPNRFFFLSLSPFRSVSKHQSSGMSNVHMYSCLTNDSHSHCDSRSFHFTLRKQIPCASAYAYACVCVFWVVVYTE